MLTPYRRHKTNCPHRAEGRAYRRCSCPIWADGIFDGAEIRQSLRAQHRIDDHRKGPCLECIAKLEAQLERQAMTSDPNKQIERGDWVRFRNLPADCKPTPILVTLVLRNGMICLLDKAGYYAAYLFMVTEPPTKLPSAADLDAVADDERAKARTGRKV